MRRIAAALTVPALGILLLAGCGSSGGSSSASSSSGGSGTNTPVTVTGAFGANPQVTIPASKASGNLAIKTVIKGTGATLADTDSFVGNYAVYIWSGTTHKLALSTFTQGTPQVLAAKVGLPGEGPVRADDGQPGTGRAAAQRGLWQPGQLPDRRRASRHRRLRGGPDQ